MKAGRELDRKLATTLGWESTKLGNWYDEQTDRLKSLPYFSTTWEGMGVLVEEAKKRGVFLEFSHALGGGYYGLAGCFEDGEYIILHNSSEALSTAQHAVCLIFLEARQANRGSN